MIYISMRQNCIFLDFEEFRRFVTMLEMTQDMETVMRLFQALELNQHNGCKYKQTIIPIIQISSGFHF